MTAFAYSLALQWKLDFRSRNVLLTCYAMPLAFYFLMGGVMSSIDPAARSTLVAAMTVFAVTMGALFGFPPTLCEAYRPEVRRASIVSGIPLWVTLLTSGLLMVGHLFVTSLVIYFTAPLLYDARIPADPGWYFGSLLLFVAASLSIGGAIGLGTRTPVQFTAVSTIVFLPSVLLSGIMFPADLLSTQIQNIGRIFPATWGYAAMTAPEVASNIWPLLLLAAIGIFLCCCFLHRMRKD